MGANKNGGVGLGTGQPVPNRMSYPPTQGVATGSPGALPPPNPMIQSALGADGGVNVADIIRRINETRALNPAMAGGPQQVDATPLSGPVGGAAGGVAPPPPLGTVASPPGTVPVPGAPTAPMAKGWQNPSSNTGNRAIDPMVDQALTGDAVNITDIIAKVNQLRGGGAAAGGNGPRAIAGQRAGSRRPHAAYGV